MELAPQARYRIADRSKRKQQAQTTARANPVALPARAADLPARKTPVDESQRLRAKHPALPRTIQARHFRRGIGAPACLALLRVPHAWQVRVRAKRRAQEASWPHWRTQSRGQGPPLPAAA